MLDERWLSTLDEGALTVLYDDCRDREKTMRRAGSFGLAYFWGQCAVQCCSAISAIYAAQPVDDGQLSFDQAVWDTGAWLLLGSPDPSE